MNTRILLAALLSAVAAPSIADTPTYAITAHVISAGSASHSASACFKLDAVIAEPVAGFSSGGAYTLSAGFGAVLATNDGLFANGFEDCTP